MKRLISIIFLSLLVMKIGGYFAFLSVQQIILKEEIKERIFKLLPNENLVQLSFTSEEFGKINWQEQDKEFYFNHKLYDIVRSEFNGKKYVFYCLSDDKETVVYDKIQQITQAQNDELPVKNTLASFLNLLLLKYTIPQILHFEGRPFIIEQIKRFPHWSICYYSVLISLLNPPPEA